MAVKELIAKTASKCATLGGNNAAFNGNTKTLAILDKFEKQESLGREREQMVKGNRKVAKMQAAFREFLKNYLSDNLPIEKYESACKQIDLSNIQYTAENIRHFSMALNQFKEEKNIEKRAGFFLSALINRSKEKDFVIDIENLTFGMEYLGCENTKNITVNGNLGGLTGYYAKEGSKITVNGNAGVHTGYRMSGGEIIVNGDVGEMTGHEMDGGKITVNGNIGEITAYDLDCGDVYQYKRRIVEDGVMLRKPKNK